MFAVCIVLVVPVRLRRGTFWVATSESFTLWVWKACGVQRPFFVLGRYGFPRMRIIDWRDIGNVLRRPIRNTKKMLMRCLHTAKQPTHAVCVVAKKLTLGLLNGERDMDK